MIYICGRKIRVVTGQRGREQFAKTQTVNICTKENIIGRYDYVIRTYPPHFTTEAKLREKSPDFQSIEDAVAYVETNCFGHIEVSPLERPEDPTKIDEPAPPTTTSDESDASSKSDLWERKASSIVENIIDQFVLQFLEMPYLHRVESSIHCELYKLLVNERLLGSGYPMGVWWSQLVHKEWPECLPRPEKGNRRGNFDLCVLSPHDLTSCSLADFLEGRIRPIIAIELGLDYKLDHLKEDSKKLANSQLGHGYLIHLVRQECSDNFNELEDFILNNSYDLKYAYGRISGSRAYYKLVSDVNINEMSLSPLSH